jgi:hypothetical protein
MNDAITYVMPSDQDFQHPDEILEIVVSRNVRARDMRTGT